MKKVRPVFEETTSQGSCKKNTGLSDSVGKAGEHANNTLLPGNVVELVKLNKELNSRTRRRSGSVCSVSFRGSFHCPPKCSWNKNFS